MSSKWAMGTEWITGKVTISPYWMDTQEQANEFVSYYYYSKSPDMKSVWYQQENNETIHHPYKPSQDEETEKWRQSIADSGRVKREGREKWNLNF